MISMRLGKLEEDLQNLFDDIAVDAVLDNGLLKTTFISTEHDPSVGIFGGEIFTLWWKLKGSEVWEKLAKKRWPARKALYEEFPDDVVLVKEKWEVPKEDATEDLEVLMRNRKIIYNALMDLEMRPF